MKIPEQLIIEKTLNNEASPEEAQEVVQWFATQEGQAWLSKRMDVDKEEVQEGTEAAYINHSIPSADMYENIMKKVRKQKIRRLFLNVAAIVVPMLMFAGLYIELNSRVDLFATAEYDEVYVPNGEQMQILFQDGTRAYLNSGSRLRYPRKFGMTERKVELDGEGWFDVAKSKGRPFIIDLDVVKAKVLGTTFNIKAYSEDSDIVIGQETGSIEFSGLTFTSFNLNPGEKVIYNKASGKCSVIRSGSSKASSLWKEKIIDFYNTPLVEVMATLSRSFDISFEVENQKALKYHYTLRTGNTNLDTIIEELEKIAPVRFERQENRIYVKLEK